MAFSCIHSDGDIPTKQIWSMLIRSDTSQTAVVFET